MTPPSEATAAATPVLDVRGLHVSYRRHGRLATTAVDDVDLALSEGEVLAVVGASGSGKSSLAAALLGLHNPESHVTADTLKVLDVDVRQASQRQWQALRRSGISLMPQDPLVSLNPAMRIGTQVREALRMANTTAEIPQVIRRLEEAGLDGAQHRLGQYPHELSGGQRQRVLIAIALACRPHVIIADEPTSALDVTVQRRVLDHLELLVREHGISLVLITHDLAVAAQRSQRMLVMDNGRVAEHGPTHQLLTVPTSPATKQLLDAAPGLLTGQRLARGQLEEQRAERPAESSSPLISFQQVSKVYRIRSSSGTAPGVIQALEDVSLAVPRGQTLGIVGESGSGKSTLLRVALALSKPTVGSVVYDGQHLHKMTTTALRQARRNFQFVQQDPYASLDPRYTVGRAIAEPLVAFRLGNRGQRRARVTELLELVELPAAFAARLPRELSGGQRQRVAIARALASEPEAIYFDEPVSALDVTVQALLLGRLIDIQQRLQLTYVFVSHDINVIARMAHRIAVMQAGRIVEQGTTSQILGSPHTAYTQELLDAVPQASLRNNP